MKARAEASERLSDEIVASLTSGLLVVDFSGIVRTLNPAGRKLLGLTDEDSDAAVSRGAGSAPELAALIDECLSQAQPVVRRTVKTVGVAGATPPRRHGLADPRRRRSRLRGDLPVRGPQRNHGPRRSAAAEGQPGAARRADRGHRPRVPQRSRHDPRLRAAARISSACRRTSGPTSRAFARRPRRSGRSSRTSSTSPSRRS